MQTELQVLYRVPHLRTSCTVAPYPQQPEALSGVIAMSLSRGKYEPSPGLAFGWTTAKNAAMLLAYISLHFFTRVSCVR